MWIEISLAREGRAKKIVTPRAGVWIEILQKNNAPGGAFVTPRAGVWIEIFFDLHRDNIDTRHSPCGSVD